MREYSLRPMEPRKARDVRMFSRVNERDHDVSCAFCRIKSFVVVCQPSGVHKHPADFGLRYLTIIAEEPASAALKNQNSPLDFDFDESSPHSPLLHG